MTSARELQPADAETHPLPIVPQLLTAEQLSDIAGAAHAVVTPALADAHVSALLGHILALELELAGRGESPCDPLQ